MRRISRSALVPYSAGDIYRLVDDIDAYPAFLPWCETAEVLERDADHVTAKLGFARGGLSRTFTTRNQLSPTEGIDLSLVDGPFRSLAGQWSFQQLGDGGSKVSLDLEFQLESRIADMLIGPFFEEICNRLVDAFSKRAEQVYGDRRAPRAG